MPASTTSALRPSEPTTKALAASRPANRIAAASAVTAPAPTTSSALAGTPSDVSRAANSARVPRGSLVRNRTPLPSARSLATASFAPAINSPPTQTTPSRSIRKPSQRSLSAVITLAGIFHPSGRRRSARRRRLRADSGRIGRDDGRSRIPPRDDPGSVRVTAPVLALELVAVSAAGAAAGAFNALAGAGSLITFPTMVALGVPQLSANVTSTIGLIPGAIGGSIGYADLLTDQGRRLARLVVPSLIGAAGGTALLLATPGHTFEVVVPVLIAGSCILLLLQPTL